MEATEAPEIVNKTKPEPVIKIDKKTRELWITQLMRDYPRCDRTMCEVTVDGYLYDPDYINGIAEGTIQPPPKEPRNENYTYEGITVQDPPPPETTPETISIVAA